jgi:hypothetical protein
VRRTLLALFIAGAAVPLRADELTRWTAELTGDLAREAWDYNLSDEDLAGGAASFLYRVSRHWSIGAEVAAIHVHQETIPGSIVSGLSTVVRWRHRGARLSPYVECGVGLSNATKNVPARGTRFNYLAQIGAGITRPLSPRVQFVLGIRWFHLSNNGLAGRSRNPDIQALGIRAGIAVPF